MSALWSIIASWWGGISLRIKIIASVAASVLSVGGYLYARWRIAAAQAGRADDRADRLQAARDAELAILRRQKDAQAKREKLRKEIAKRKERDYFEDTFL